MVTDSLIDEYLKRLKYSCRSEYLINIALFSSVAISKVILFVSVSLYNIDVDAYYRTLE